MSNQTVFYEITFYAINGGAETVVKGSVEGAMYVAAQQVETLAKGRGLDMDRGGHYSLTDRDGVGGYLQDHNGDDYGRWSLYYETVEAETEAELTEAETHAQHVAETSGLQSECQTCGSDVIDHYYGKDGFYSGAYCAEHAPIAYETSTGRPIFHDTRATFIVGGMNPTDKHVTTVYRNVHPDQVAARVAELEGRGWTRIYATFEAF
ncbi:hypothetical protein PBI_MANDA_138 [Mycobacterium phage Manda]|nr:hypothetical protein PBI_MANDA_138 [Mycobacterium phage Manda]